MKTQSLSISTAAFGIALVLAAIAPISALSAGIKNEIYDYSLSSNPAAFNSGYGHYVDWTSTPAYGSGHSTYDTMSWHGPSKYLDYGISVSGSYQSRCFFLSTSNTLPEGQNADTEILVRNSDGIWVKLSDDPTYTGTYAHAYFYLFTGANTMAAPVIRVAAYSQYHNKEAFMMQSQWFSNEYNSCLEGVPSLPGSVKQAGAYIIGSTVTINRVL